MGKAPNETSIQSGSISKSPKGDLRYENIQDNKAPKIANHIGNLLYKSTRNSKVIKSICLIKATKTQKHRKQQSIKYNQLCERISSNKDPLKTNHTRQHIYELTLTKREGKAIRHMATIYITHR